MTTRRSGSLFTGVLGLDRAVAEVLGTELAWTCDNDPGAAKVIEHRAPGVPNLGDITIVDWDQVEPVWLLTGGSPCQDVSAAGKRAGMYPGTRSGLWAHMTYAIKRLRPRYVVFENVRGLSSACATSEMGQCAGCVGDGPHRPVLRALGRVLGDLADLGYDAVWCGLPAAAVGACHERFRIFILAVDTAADATSDGRHEGRPEPAGLIRGPDAAQRGGEAPADTAGPRRPRHLASAPVARDGGAAEVAGEVQPRGLDRAWGRWSGSADSGDAASDSDGAGLEGREPAAGRDMPAGGTDWGIYTTAIRRWERVIGRPAPVPRVVGPRGGLKLNPALPEWMQGFPAGWITDVPGVSVNDALKLAGNSVNSFQAVAALRWLTTQLAEAPA